MRDLFLSNNNSEFLNRIKECLKKCNSFSFSVSFIKNHEGEHTNEAELTVKTLYVHV